MKKLFHHIVLCTLASLLAFGVSCSKDSSGDDTPGGKESTVFTGSLSISGSGSEYSSESVSLLDRGDGIWEIYADFIGGESISVTQSEGGEYLSIKVPATKDGTGLLRINTKDKSWQIIRINKVSLVVSEGIEGTPKEGAAPPIEAEYKGKGVWSVGSLYIASDFVRYRYELDTDTPAALKYWCATWDNAGSTPASHTAEYLGIRELGQTQYDELYLKENRACWMFPVDKTLLLADFSISMNTAAPTQEISYTSPHTGPTAVFIGDSITWQWARASRTDSKSNIVIPLNPLPSFMKESGDNVITYFHPKFFSDNDYVNRGVSGENTTQMLARYKLDVLDMDPHCVVIMGGTNDLAQGYSKNTIMENLSSMAEQAAAEGMKVVLCSITPCNQSYSRLTNPSTKGAHILELNKMIKSYADSKDFTYCDYYPTLVASDGLSLREDYCLYDYLHPNPDAYTEMEKIIQAIINEVNK